MDQLRRLYKDKPVNDRIARNRETLLANRKSRRLQQFDNNRIMIDTEIKELQENGPEKQNQRRDRGELLQDWKERKMRLKIKPKKKPFIVGIVHHNAGSPLVQDIPNKFNKIVRTNPTAVVAKPILVPTLGGSASHVPFKPVNENHQFKFTVKPSTKKLTIPHSPTFMSSKKKSSKPVAELNTGRKLDAHKENNVKKPTRSCVTRLKVADKKEKIRSKKEQINTEKKEASPMTPPLAKLSSGSEQEFVISPFVMTVRGKHRGSIQRPIDSARKQREHCEIGSNNSTTEHEGATFYKQLDNESRRLVEKCELWTKIYVQSNLPTGVQDEIDSVVGQSRLLVKDKFEQFRNLIERFENKVEPPVNVDDLNGFWDMMYIQVDKLIERFNKLDNQKNNNWVVSAPEPQQSKPKKKVVPKSKPQIKSKGNFRNFLKGLNKPKNQTEKSNAEPAGLNLSLNNVTVTETNTLEDGNDLMDTSKTTAASTSLLKKVLSNSVTRRRSSVASGLCALRTSLIGKELGTSPLKLVEDSCTGGSQSKSILKKELPTKQEKPKKSVLFSGNTVCEELNTTFVVEESTDQIESCTEECTDFFERLNGAPDPCLDVFEEPNLDSQITPSVNKSSHKQRFPTPGPNVTPRRSIRIRIKSNPAGSDFTPRRSLRLKRTNNYSPV